MTPSLTQQATILINRARMTGQIPVVFHMNATTMRTILAELAQTAQERRSPLGRLIHGLRGTRLPERLQELAGVPVGENPTLPDGLIFLATKQAEAIPVGGNLAEAIQKASRQANAPWPPAPDQANAQAPMQEFVQREKVESGAEVTRPTLDQLAGNPDRVSPSDILMKAFDGIDEVKQIVVIRVHRNNDISMCLNADQFSAQGIIQRAQIYLHQRFD